MPPVLSTYRLQLHGGFPLTEAGALAEYFAELGVTHLHASPIFAARPGSTHGYDVTDPLRVNPELGGAAAFERLVDALQGRGLGLVLDIVPNHMAAARENQRWEDVLRLGSSSPYAAWFDIDWRAGEADARDRIVLPVLGDVRVRALDRGEITLAVEDGEFRVRYFEHSFPVDPATLTQVLARASRFAAEELGDEHPDVAALAAATETFWRMPRRSSRAPRAAEQRIELAAEGTEQLRQVWTASPAIRAALERAAADFTDGDEGKVRLRRLLDQQPYRLVFWRRAAREINYRRFFDINELVSLHMENPDVFRAHHALVLEWRERGWVDGFRIDHPDGLLDPARYFERLADAAFEWRPDGRYPIWAEKILSHGERLRRDWPIAGTTGYDFLNQAEALFVDAEGYGRLARHYHRIIRRPLDFGAVARLSKRLVLDTSLGAAVRQSAERLQRLVRSSGREPVGTPALLRALAEMIIYLPVYRTYIDARRPLPEGDDLALLERTLAETRERGRAAAPALSAVADTLLGTDPRLREGAHEQLRLRLIERLQQLSGPAAAKGVEDTAFYRYVALLSRNEVGGEPGADLAGAVDEFHAANRERAEHWPAAMLAVTTHDTKRSADARARLDVLSEIPDEWESCLYRWRRVAGRFKRRVGERLFPDTNVTWLFFQTLVGVWPLDAASGSDAATPPDGVLAELRERLTAYMEKAIREAKTFTSWTDPDEAYEAAVRGYVEGVLDPARSAQLLGDIGAFVRTVARPGLWNSLARTLIQLSAPGVPDVYQGDELWTFSLVDPDNRRPVDWDRRRALLRTLDGADPPELVRSAEDGRIKLYLYRTLLRLRRERPELFIGAGYEPVRAHGERAAHLVGFARIASSGAAVALAPRLVRTMVADPAEPPLAGVWGDTAVALPEQLRGRAWRCALTGRDIEAAPDGSLRAADLFAQLPVALVLG